jgi:Zn-dependent M32 family carboxypeptidase
MGHTNAQNAFSEDISTATSAKDVVYEAVNAVAPPLIRVETDELAYPLYVILQYNIEKDVMAGDLQVKDIPHCWNADMKSMLHVNINNDDYASGCMQDVHWSALAIGYFPIYLILDQPQQHNWHISANKTWACQKRNGAVSLQTLLPRTSPSNVFS